MSSPYFPHRFRVASADLAVETSHTTATETIVDSVAELPRGAWCVEAAFCRYGEARGSFGELAESAFEVN